MRYIQGANNTPHIYVAQDGTNIVIKECVKDLGVTFTCYGGFAILITNVTKKARSHAGWIQCTFKTGDAPPMLTL